MNNNKFLDKILILPDKKKINNFFRASFMFVIIFIPLVFFSFYDNVSFVNNIFPQTTFFLKFFIVFFVIISIFFRFLIKKFPQFIFIYIAISFGSFSLFSFIISCIKIYAMEVLRKPFNILILILILTLYILEIIFFNIFCLNKEKKNSFTRNPPNNNLTRSFISLAVILGMLSSRYTSNTELKFMILILSYITLIAVVFSINRFRLLIKYKVNIKK